MIVGFDYSRYLREKKISGIVKSEEWIIISQEKDFKYYLFQLKQKLLDKLDKNYDIEEASFLKAILLGNTSELNEDIKESFKNANISHILAISGMHIAYIVLGIESVLKTFIKDIKIRNGCIIIFLGIFAIFVGESNSVCRACIMTSIVYLGKILLRKDDFYTSFKVALSILLLVNPYHIASGSMWLSFGGSIGIVLYSKLIEKIILKKWKVKNKFLEKVIAILSVTLGAQIVVFPIMIYIFNTISFNFLISNLLISELVAPILILGYCSLFFPFISIYEKVLIKIIFFLANFCANLPLNQILVATPKLYQVILYYLILIYLAFLFHTKKISFMRRVKQLNWKIIVIIFLILVLLFGNIHLPFRKNFEIHFLDVGQGDSCLVRTKTNKVILIDGGKGINGEYDYGKNVVGPYLLDHGITKVDYVIVSHFDSDHCGGLFDIIEKFHVKHIMIGKQAEEYTNLMNFLELQQKKRINLIVLEAGDTFQLDKETKISVLFPDINHEISENKINNNSLVFKMHYRNTSMLFTGDIEEESENVLVNLYGESLRADILKVGHHGSKTSSIQEFLEVVRPRIALIGVGKDNHFGHPNSEVLDRLENMRNKDL